VSMLSIAYGTILTDNFNAGGGVGWPGTTCVSEYYCSALNAC